LRSAHAIGRHRHAPGCKELARQVGPIASFGPPPKLLTDEKLATCNTSAEK